MQPEQHHDETFTDQRIELHGCFFHHCRVERCFDDIREHRFADGRSER